MSLLMNENNINMEVENYVFENGGEYIDAVLYICEKYNIEPKIAAKHLSKPIIEKLEVEGRQMHLLPRKSAKLPI